jgi:hypothetical protein
MRTGALLVPKASNIRTLSGQDPELPSSVAADHCPDTKESESFGERIALIKATPRLPVSARKSFEPR